MFGRENEHLFLRHIVGFIPRTRFEEGEEEEEGEGQVEEEEESEVKEGKEGDSGSEEEGVGVEEWANGNDTGNDNE